MTKIQNKKYLNEHYLKYLLNGERKTAKIITIHGRSLNE